MKKFFVVLMASLMLFAFVSCTEEIHKHEYDSETGKCSGCGDYLVSTEDQLKGAIADSDCKNITLNADLTLTNTITITNDTTLDMNGKEIASSKTPIQIKGAKVLLKGNGTIDVKGALGGATCIRIIDNGDLTIENGTFKSNQQGIAVGSMDSVNKKFISGTVLIKEGTFESVESTLCVFGASVLTVEGGTYSASDNAVISVNGSNYTPVGHKITVNGGTFNGNTTSTGYIACGIYSSNTGDVILNGGEFNIEGGVGVLVRSGKLTANKVTIKLTDKTGFTSGSVGDSKIKLKAGFEIVVDDQANYPGEKPVILVNATGYTAKNINGDNYTPSTVE